MHGAKIHEQVRVTGFEMDGDRITKVKTDKGDIACEKVVNCAGQWARQVGEIDAFEQTQPHQQRLTAGCGESSPQRWHQR